MPIEVKICGLSSAEAVSAAVEGGAAMLGFVFFPASPRAIAADRLEALTRGVPGQIIRVGLFVNAADHEIEAAVTTGMIDMLQLHGGETPADVVRLKERFGLPVMKAVAVSGPPDLEVARTYEPVVDRLLFDARPPKQASRPGGNALAFDWSLLNGVSWAVPWLLAGGLNAQNLTRATAISGAMAVDVSSGVEDAPGAKNTAKIRHFLNLAATL